MDNQELNSSSKLTSFPEEEATPISNIDTSSNNGTQVNNQSDNILNKEIVTRPLLWGIVVFLVFFSFVIGAVSVYRMYQVEDTFQGTLIDDNFGPPPMPCGDGGVGCALPPADVLSSTPVTGDTIKEADLIESEIKSIDSDLEEDIYSDEVLGL